MILVDTSIWVDHFRQYDETLVSLLQDGQVLIHPFIVGELALGNFRNRADVINLLQSLPKVNVASENNVLTFITSYNLSGSGIGYVDAHLIASCLIQGETKIITQDKKLASVSVRILLLS